VRGVAALLLAVAALAAPAVALGFDNTEPLAGNEWYLGQDEAWSFWPTVPKLAPVRVAVIDSGIDGSHPDLRGRVVAAKSFVGGSPFHDEQGHGTFVAGEIGANPFNGIGMAGIAFNARLLIAKVVGPDGTVSLPAEVAGIRWAADNGARVINLSLGGVRDPLSPQLDTYSPLEQAAVEYAYAKGAVVVAAVGNGPQSPATPWGFAHYPAALPHVIGVSALRRDGSVPVYSNRDAVYNDLAAPGDGIFSTIPSNLVVRRAGCAEHPYSDCGSFEFRDAIGTSFAAPQVSAAAALLLGVDPSLTPDQVSWLLERSATDITSETCRACIAGRDSLTGWGRLNVAAALQALRHKSELPQPDAYEPNDDAGAQAHPFGEPRTITATLDYWDDPTDVYSIKLRAGEILSARLSSSLPIGRMQLWAPGTTNVGDQRATLADGARRTPAVAARERLDFRARAAGTYYLAVRVGKPTRERPVYNLTVAKRLVT